MGRRSLKVLTILGTRPEIIRLSRVIALLDRYTHHVLVHTGQNYDYELNELFFQELGVRKPDHFLRVDTASLGTVLGGVITGIEPVLREEKPDAVLILGDTNSSLAGIVAKRMKVPVYHMEAGNRCFDENVPEEINRKIIDHIADFNLVYTEHGRRHLEREGLPPKRIILTGSPMGEVIRHYQDRIDASGILKTLDLREKRFFLVSLHREENVDSPVILKRIIHILNGVAGTYGYPIIFSTHPRTRKRLEGLGDMETDARISFHKPFGYYDYMKLQMNAACTISDSGTISEESAILSFPAITLRESMERPEALDAGTIILTGFDPDTVLDSIDLVIQEDLMHEKRDIPAEYTVRNTSWRVCRLIMGTARQSNKWSGIRVTEDEKMPGNSIESDR